MIFIMKSDGTIMPSIPSPVYQGADGTNVIYLFAPSAVGNMATVAFRTPDGVWTEREPMTQVANLPEEFAKYQYCVWQYSIGAPIARLDGVVTVQFFFYANGAILPSSASSFVVGKGVPVILPTEPSRSAYDQILQAISAIQKSQQYGDYAARAIFEWRKSRTDGAAVSYGIGEFTYVPAGAEGGPAGKTGSFIKSLVDKNTQPPYVDGKVNSEYWEEVVNFDYLHEQYFSDLQDLAKKAERYKEAAETAQGGALSAKEAAEAAQTGALTAKEGAQTAETNAWESAEAASASEGNAAASERNAAEHEKNAEDARDGAVEAKEAAELAAGQAAGDVLEQLRELKEEAAQAAKDAQTAQEGAEEAAEKTASAVEADLQAIKDEAQEAAKNAQAAEQGAVDAENGANAVLADTTREKEAAEQAVEEALAAKSGAEKALTETIAAKEAAETAQEQTLTLKNEAQEAQTQAETYKEQAGEYAAQTARDAASAIASAQTATEAAARAEEFAKYGIRINTDYASLEDLPRPGNTQLIYFIPNGSSAPNAFDEYVWTESGEYEKIGTTEIDLSAYLTKDAAAQTYATKNELSSETQRAQAAEQANAGAIEAVRKVANAAIPESEKGTPNGVATLDGSGKVPSGQLPASLPPSGNAGGDLKGTYPNPEIKTGAVTPEKCSEAVKSSLEKANVAIPSTEKGKAGGVASLGDDGKVPNSQLPGLYRHTIYIQRTNGATLRSCFMHINASPEPLATYDLMCAELGNYSTVDGTFMPGFTNSAPATLTSEGGKLRVLHHDVNSKSFEKEEVDSTKATFSDFVEKIL